MRVTTWFYFTVKTLKEPGSLCQEVTNSRQQHLQGSCLTVNLLFLQSVILNHLENICICSTFSELLNRIATLLLLWRNNFHLSRYSLQLLFFKIFMQNTFSLNIFKMMEGVRGRHEKYFNLWVIPPHIAHHIFRSFSAQPPVYCLKI